MFSQARVQAAQAHQQQDLLLTVSAADASVTCEGNGTARRFPDLKLSTNHNN
jgi:hypothetical protein